MSGCNERQRGDGRVRTPALAVFAGLTCALALSGCGGGPRSEAPFMLANPSERHPILVSSTEARLDIPVHGGSYGLSRNQESRLYSFLSDFRRDGASRMVIRAPAGSLQDRSAMRVFADVRDILQSEGFTRDMVVLESYHASYKSAAPLRLSYARVVAKGPDCPDWSENIGRDPENMPYPNLGCATQRNFAAMVANPNDLVQQRASTPRSSDRRDTVWGKYVVGEPTGADWEPNPIPERATETTAGQ